MVNGVKITGGARGNYIRKHVLEINGRSPDIQDLAAAEKLLVDMLNGEYGTKIIQGDRDIYTAEFEGHKLLAAVGVGSNGERKLFTITPK